MDMSASLQNDTAKTIYTYEAQLPYLNMTLDELQEQFELNNIPVTNETSTIITVPAAVTPGSTQIGFTTIPALPSNLIEIQQLWEELTNTPPFVQMTRLDFLPHYLEGYLVQQFQYWCWKNQAINVPNSNQVNDLKLDYIQSIFPTPLNNTQFETELGIKFKNVKTYLGYKTAALCSMYIGENETRAMSLNGQAEEALSRTLGINIKGRQAIMTRRQPFRAAYKRRSVW